MGFLYEFAMMEMSFRYGIKTLSCAPRQRYVLKYGSIGSYYFFVNVVASEPVTSHINLYITYGRRVGLGLDKEYSILYALVIGSLATAFC